MLKVNYSDSENNVNLFFYGKVMPLSERHVPSDKAGAFEIVMSLFFVVSLVFSAVGNVCTCAVIVRDRSMRTPTNYYLFNLAIADLTTAMFIPFEIIILWIPDVFGKVTGHIVFLFWDLLCNCSALTILALTIERYIVISKPFLRHTFVLSSRVFKILAINWTIAASFCMLNVFYIYNIEEHSNVYIYFNKQPNGHVVFLMAAEVIIFFILPMMVIAMLYALITLKLKTRNSLRHSPPNFAKQNRSKAIKMLAAIAASFFICWSPYCVLRIMAIVPKLRQKDYIKYWQIFCYLNCINSYVSTAVNPILYSLMSRKFRRAFKELLKNRKTDCRITGQELKSSTKNVQKPAETTFNIINIENQKAFSELAVLG